jgi:hypothetical protein
MLLERIKYILMLAFFLACLGLSIKLVGDGELRLGWASVALWGVMSALTVYYMIRDCFTSEARARHMEKARAAKSGGAKSRLDGLKAHLVTIWSIFAAILIGAASSLVTKKLGSQVVPSIAVWLGSFFFTLAFYPFQKRQKDGIREFPVWAIYSALMGVLSIIFFHVEGWLR